MDGYLRFALALIFVIALIGVLAVLVRRLGFGFPAGTTKNAGNRRIEVVEITSLDVRRKLILVRRDDVEHLLVVSPTSELVIETGIRADANSKTRFRDALDTATRTSEDRDTKPAEDPE